MKPIDCKMRTHFTIQGNKTVSNATKRMKKILNTNYKKGNLKKIVNNLKYLNNDKQCVILKISRKREEMFDGTLGNYTGPEYKIELLEGVKPYHAKPFPIPKLHKEIPRTEVNRIVNIGVLKSLSNSKWAALTFIIPKKNATVRLISDFRELNNRIKIPNPNI